MYVYAYIYIYIRYTQAGAWRSTAGLLEALRSAGAAADAAVFHLCSIYIYIYIYIYIHTYIHTYIHNTYTYIYI